MDDKQQPAPGGCIPCDQARAAARAARAAARRAEVAVNDPANLPRLPRPEDLAGSQS